MAYITRTDIDYHYKNYLCSITGLFFIILLLFAILFPYLLAYSIGNIWKHFDLTHDQPQISLTGQYALQCFSGFENSTSSNVPAITNLDQSDFEYQMIDENEDGIAEFIKFKIAHDPQITVDSCTLILFTNVGFREKIRLQMIQPILLNINAQFQQYQIHIIGELELLQTHSLPESASTRIVYNNTNFNYTYNLFDLDQALRNRNETMIPQIQQFQYVKQSNNWVIIDGFLRIPIFQKIVYTPTIMMNFKRVWIQYIFIAIPIFFLLQQLGLFSLRRKIFHAHKQMYNDQYLF